MILADTSLEEACQVAERIRACVAAQPFITDQASIPVTTSIGAAEATRQPLVKVSQFLELGRQKLYAAKQGMAAIACGALRIKFASSRDRDRTATTEAVTF